MVMEPVIENIIECQIVDLGSAYSQQQVYIKTISIHDYSQLQDLKQNLLERRDSITILIAKITQIVSKDAEAVSKVVNGLYDCVGIRKNYTLFRLGQDRLLLIPNNAKTQQI